MQAHMLNNKSRRGPSQKQIHSESGVTILEMVVAMLILTVGLLGLAASIGYAVTVSNKGRNGDVPVRAIAPDTSVTKPSTTMKTGTARSGPI